VVCYDGFMRRHELQQIIPIALQELHEAGFEQVYVDQLGERISTFETSHLSKRRTLSKVLGAVGIRMPILPSGHLRPGPAKIYPALYALEDEGIVKGEFEPPREDGESSRRMYSLVDSADQ
jgi:DNA-binding transcriptional ArsR family regulator